MKKISYDSLPDELQELKERVERLELIIKSIVKAPDDNPYKDTIEAGLFLKKTPNAVRILAFNKSIPTIKRGRKLYFHVNDLTNWMEEGRRGRRIQVLK